MLLENTLFNPLSSRNNSFSELFKQSEISRAGKFLASLGAEPTPLRNLNCAAASLGLKSLHVKDEAPFLGLNSFKGRGALWAMAKISARIIAIPDADLDFSRLSGAFKECAQSLEFVAATDGNHGKAVAYGAKRLGQKAVIFMPAGASQARIEAIRSHEAECRVTNLNYDATVQIASEYAKKHGAIPIQDTAWPGYEEIPGWIMQGYATMAFEIAAQLNGELPTHIFLQIGVGSFAGAIVAAFKLIAGQTGQLTPQFIGLEPEGAACFYESLASGKRQAVKGDLATVMDGLACGEVSSVAWPILAANVSAALRCPDKLALEGMAFLAAAQGSDPKIISGPSGAIGMGALANIMKNSGLRAKLGLNSSARVLLISTEGDNRI